MFVHDFKIIDGPFEQVGASLASGTEALLSAALAATRVEMERMRWRAGANHWPLVLAKRTEVSAGPMRDHGDWLLLAFSWSGEDGTPLMSHLDADLEVTPFGPSQTALALRGRYQPPAAVLARRGDERFVEHIAESTIRAFLDELCSILSGRVVQD